MTVSDARRLGARGGKATASKRTKEQRSAAAKKASQARWESIRQDLEPDAFIFERALDGDWFVEKTDKKGKSYYYSNHRARVLLDAGYIELDHTEDHIYPEKPSDDYTSIYYRATETGMQWWFSKRISDYETNAKQYEHYAPMLNWNPADLREIVGGKGIGFELSISPLWNGPALFKALRDGLLKFISHQDYSGMPHGANENMILELTPSGFAYFASLAIPIEVWE